jgi:acetyltransferase
MHSFQKLNPINNFFYPETICIAGASSKEKSIGYELLNSIKSYGYTGRIYPVNPKAEFILGYKCFRSIEEINEKIDLGIVVVPKAFSEETIDQLIDKGVKSIILITAGFKETGNEGEQAEKRILEKIKNANVRLVGPNCMGVITTFPEIMLNATFVAEKPETGNTAFLSQSGAIGAALLNSLRETDIRFGHFISVGNKADICENDLLEYWNNDDKIKTITMYLESFTDGESFLTHFTGNKMSKPVIILKAGRTSAGIKAASSHTGALGSSDKVVNSVLEQFGIIRVNDLNEMFNTAKGFENFPIPKGNRIAVVTNAGGPSILTVDKLECENLVLAQLSAETKAELKLIVHPEGSVNNPVDLLPGGTAEQFKEVNKIVLEDENVDAVISVFVEPVMVPAFEVIESINTIKSDKPLLQVVMPLPEFWEKYRHQSQSKKPLFRRPEDPAEIISNMIFFSQNKNKKERLKYSNLFSEKGDSGVVYSDSSIITNRAKEIVSSSPRFLSQQETITLLSSYHIPNAASLFVSPKKINNLSDLDFPICLKGISSEVIHKTEMNAVKLNIASYEDLRGSALEMEKSFSDKGFTIEKFLIQPFLKAKHELLIGGFRDSSFGPMIMFGSGGKYVEVVNDTFMKSAYLFDDDIDDMINRTNAGKIIKGVRGERGIDINIIKSIIRNTAQMMVDNKNILEFDLNPVIVTDDDGIVTVDARIRLKT